MEKLPTEIWFKVFRYLSFDELITGFDSLNTRIQSIISGYCSHHLNMQCLYRTAFQTICRNYLQYDHPSSEIIHFSDHEDCLQQIHTFQQLGYTFDRLVNLRSLSFSHIDSMDLLNRIIVQLGSLPRLTDLKMTKLDKVATKDEFPLIFNPFWQLPSLSSLEVAIDTDFYIRFPEHIPHSSTLQRLKLMNCECSTIAFVRLLSNTPMLRNLAIRVKGTTNQTSLPIQDPHSNISFLQIDYEGGWNALHSLFQLMPKLKNLQINTNRNVLHPQYGLNQSIGQSLTYLRSLQFFIRSTLNRRPSKERDIIPFYNQFEAIALANHLTRYSLRYDYIRHQGYYYNQFYTIPCIESRCDNLLKNSDTRSQSNMPALIGEHCYDRITWLEYDEIPFSEDLPFIFSNIDHLRLPLSSDRPFDRNLIRLNRLVSLALSIYDENMLNSVQPILDEAIHLRRLKFLRWSISLINRIHSSSVRDLDISGFRIDSQAQYFDNATLELFKVSSWVNQCVILSISLEKSTWIGDLINRLKNLQLLIVKCRDDGWPMTLSSDPDDLYLERLRQRFPPTYRLVRQAGLYGTTKIWIT